MKSKQTIERELAKLEKRLAEQLREILESEKGFGGPQSYLFDQRLLQRHALRFVLGRPHKAFHRQADWESWSR